MKQRLFAVVSVGSSGSHGSVNHVPDTGIMVQGSAVAKAAPRAVLLVSAPRGLTAQCTPL